jgi:hypothetical protein
LQHAVALSVRNGLHRGVPLSGTRQALAVTIRNRHASHTGALKSNRRSLRILRMWLFLGTDKDVQGHCVAIPVRPAVRFRSA